MQAGSWLVCRCRLKGQFRISATETLRLPQMAAYCADLTHSVDLGVEDSYESAWFEYSVRMLGLWVDTVPTRSTTEIRVANMCNPQYRHGHMTSGYCRHRTAKLFYPTTPDTIKISQTFSITMDTITKVHIMQHRGALSVD
jgi:hypothetical protein